MTDHRATGGEDQADLDLRRLLAAADPASPGKSPGLTSEEMETLMSTIQQSDNAPASPTGRARSRWVLGLVAAATVAAVGLGAAMWLPTDEQAPPVATEPLELRLPSGADTALQSCIALSDETLQMFPVAFSGTAVDVAGDRVTLDVDTWYRGDDAASVLLTTQFNEQLQALIGAIEFVQGERYLVTASEGVVATCGFSAAWSSDLEMAFQSAFGPGTPAP